MKIFNFLSPTKIRGILKYIKENELAADFDTDVEFTQDSYFAIIKLFNMSVYDIISLNLNILRHQ